jgi:hypothetical protein
MARSIRSKCGRSKSPTRRDVEIKFAASMGRVYWSYDRGYQERLEGHEGGDGSFIGEGEGRVCD